MFLSK